MDIMYLIMVIFILSNAAATQSLFSLPFGPVFASFRCQHEGFQVISCRQTKILIFEPKTCTAYKVLSLLRPTVCKASS